MADCTLSIGDEDLLDLMTGKLNPQTVCLLTSGPIYMCVHIYFHCEMVWGHTFAPWQLCLPSCTQFHYWYDRKGGNFKSNLSVSRNELNWDEMTFDISYLWPVVVAVLVEFLLGSRIRARVYPLFVSKSYTHLVTCTFLVMLGHRRMLDYVETISAF